MRTFVTWLLVFLLGSVGIAPGATAVGIPAVDVGAGADRYSGSGGLILPGSLESGTRRDAACENCRWRLRDPCSADGGPCLAVTRGCAQLASLLRLLLSSDGGATWADRGLVCIPPAGPVTVAEVSTGLRREFERLVPELLPRAQPSSGVVTRIPVNFLSGHPRGLPASVHRILGQSVVLSPSVRWRWDFGDGAGLETAEPGAEYPAGSVRHAYRRSGSVVVRVRAQWSGTFRVDDLGPFPVAGTIDQAASIEVRVGEGRAVLVP